MYKEIEIELFMESDSEIIEEPSEKDTKSDTNDVADDVKNSELQNDDGKKPASEIKNENSATSTKAAPEDEKKLENSTNLKIRVSENFDNIKKILKLLIMIEPNLRLYNFKDDIYRLAKIRREMTDWSILLTVDNVNDFEKNYKTKALKDIKGFINKLPKIKNKRKT